MSTYIVSFGHARSRVQPLTWPVTLSVACLLVIRKGSCYTHFDRTLYHRALYRCHVSMRCAQLMFRSILQNPFRHPAICIALNSPSSGLVCNIYLHFPIIWYICNAFCFCSLICIWWKCYYSRLNGNQTSVSDQCSVISIAAQPHFYSMLRVKHSTISADPDLHWLSIPLSAASCLEL